MTSFISNVQNNLSIAQATPIAGPILASPCKAAVSLVQVVGGIALPIILSPVAMVTQNEKIFEKMSSSFSCAKAGGISLAYAILNIATLGGLGYFAINCNLEGKGKQGIFYENYKI